jgi:hypothetical protein
MDRKKTNFPIRNEIETKQGIEPPRRQDRQDREREKTNFPIRNEIQTCL